MNIYNWLLLAVPFVGVFGVLAAIYLSDSHSNGHHLTPGE